MHGLLEPLSLLLHGLLPVCFSERDFAARVVAVDPDIEHSRLP